MLTGGVGNELRALHALLHAVDAQFITKHSSNKLHIEVALANLLVDIKAAAPVDFQQRRPLPSGYKYFDTLTESGDWWRFPHGFFSAYNDDDKRMDKSVPSFTPLLIELAKQKSSNLHVLGHSMGAQCLFEIMREIKHQHRHPKLGTLFFMAADISKHSFKKQYTSYLSGKAFNIVNYYCTADEALKYSSSFLARGLRATWRRSCHRPRSCEASSDDEYSCLERHGEAD